MTKQEAIEGVATAGLAFHAAWWEVESGIASFDLHNAAVERLKEAEVKMRLAREQLYDLWWAEPPPRSIPLTTERLAQLAAEMEAGHDLSTWSTRSNGAFKPRHQP